MNLKSRIKKLERTSSGGFCLCFGVPKYEAVLSRNAPGMVEKAPDLCPSCGRPVNKSCLEIAFGQHLKNKEEKEKTKPKESEKPKPDKA